MIATVGSSSVFGETPEQNMRGVQCSAVECALDTSFSSGRITCKITGRIIFFFQINVFTQSINSRGACCECDSDNVTQYAVYTST